jgi:hypothetical protein
MTSPTSKGELPSDITAAGGIVLDLVGVNGRRVVSELPASSLFRGTFDNGSPAAFRGNPGTIGVQTGFSAATLAALGGGLSDVAVRLTVFDGDTASGNFDFHDNTLLLNGVVLGDFSDVATQETTQNGQIALSSNPGGGFRNDKLDTGFFHSTDPGFLDAFFATLTSKGTLTYQLRDVGPFDNFFDFTEGLDGGLLDVGRSPRVENAPPIITSVTNDGPVTKGSAVRVTVTATDPDGTGLPLTYEFDFDNDGTFETSNTTGIAEGVVKGDGPFVVKVRVIDADGAEADADTTVEVRNLPPPPAVAPAVVPRDTRTANAPLLIALVASPPATAPAPGPAPTPTLAAVQAGTPTGPVASSQPLAPTALGFLGRSSAGDATGAEEEQDRSAATAETVRSVARLSARIADSVLAPPVRSGQQLAGTFAQAIDGVFTSFQDVATRIVTSAPAIGPVSPTGAVVAVTPSSPPTVRTPTLPPDKRRRTGAAITTTALVLSALLVQRRWSSGRTLATRLRSRRWKQQAPTAGGNADGNDSLQA